MTMEKRVWGWLVAAGVLLMIAGFMALGSPLVAGFATLLLFGWLLLFGGIVEFVQSFRMAGMPGRSLYVIGGLISILAGIVFIRNPAISGDALLMILGAYFLAGGLIRSISSIADRHANWGWSLAGGVVDVVLGLLLWNAMVVQSVAIIGIFVGITLIFRGMPWIVAGLALKRLQKA